MDVSAVTAPSSVADAARFAERVSRMPAAEQRQVVAQQFEAILLRQFLAPVLESMPGDKSGIYGYMLTDAFAQKLSAGPGLGLARMMEKQFSPPGENRNLTTSHSTGQPPVGLNAARPT
jgi:Rod binding domain-containing protein